MCVKGTWEMEEIRLEGLKNLKMVTICSVQSTKSKKIYEKVTNDLENKKKSLSLSKLH